MNAWLLHSLVLLDVVVFYGQGFIEQVKEDHIGAIVITPETRLHNDLFKSSPGRVFPLINKHLDVHFGLTLKSVVDIDASNEAVVLNAFIRQEWKNADLSWDPLFYGGIQKINVEPHKVWIPDIFSYANIENDKNYNGLLSTMKTKIILSHDGNHSWLAPVILRLGCTMNLIDYLFDSQVCPIQFGSFTYDSSRIHLIPHKVDMDTYGESSEWVFISMKQASDLVNHPGSNVAFSDVTYTLKMKRKPLYLIMNMVLPNVFLAYLAVMVFVVPINAGERGIFAITIVLALCWYMTTAIETMPSSSEVIPFFSYFLGMTSIVELLLCLSVCYTIACHYANSNFMELPKWMREVIIGRLTVFFGLNISRRKAKWRQKLEILNSCYDVEGYKNVGRSSDDSQSCEENLGKLWSNEELLETSFTSDEELSLADIFGTNTLHEMNERISIVLHHICECEDGQWIQREWELVAKTFDKLFLYIFAGIYLTALIWFSIRLSTIE